MSLLCRLITDAGLAALALKLPGALQQLRLNMDTCEQVDDDGVATLAVKLPYTLQTRLLLFLLVLLLLVQIS